MSPTLIEITTIRQAQQRATMGAESMLGRKQLLVLPPTIRLMAQASAGTPAAVIAALGPVSSAPEENPLVLPSELHG